MMMDPKPSNRPQAAEILEHFLLTDAGIELKWLDLCKKNLKREVEQLKLLVQERITGRSRSAEAKAYVESKPFLA